MIDEDIVPTDKREKVELDLQSLPETWDGLVAKADENKKKYVIVYMLHDMLSVCGIVARMVLTGSIERKV